MLTVQNTVQKRSSVESLSKRALSCYLPVAARQKQHFLQKESNRYGNEDMAARMIVWGRLFWGGEAMQKNKATREITHMEEGEIVIYELYVKEGLKRGDLPYTEHFERIAKGYNKQMKANETKHDLWVLLEKVLKGGESAIEAYLRQQRVNVAA